MPLQGEWQSFSRHIPTRTAATIFRRCQSIGYSPVWSAVCRAHLHACGLESPAVCWPALHHVPVTIPLSRQNAMERPRLAGSRAAGGWPGERPRRPQPPIPGETASCRQSRRLAPARAPFSSICLAAVSTIPATSSSATNPHSTARSSVGPARASRRPANNRARSCRSAPVPAFRCRVHLHAGG